MPTSKPCEYGKWTLVLTMGTIMGTIVGTTPRPLGGLFVLEAGVALVAGGP